MSESENESPESSLKLNDADQKRYESTLRRQGALSKCASCGAKNSQGILSSKSPIYLFHMHEALVGVQERHVEAVVAACTNCGLISFHSTVLLDSKDETRPEIEGDNGK